MVYSLLLAAFTDRLFDSCPYIIEHIGNPFSARGLGLEQIPISWQLECWWLSHKPIVGLPLLYADATFSVTWSVTTFWPVLLLLYY